MADARVVVLDEAGGVEHGLAPGGRRVRVDGRWACGGLPAEAAGMEAWQHRIAVNAGERFHERAGQPVAPARRPVGERGDGAEQPAIAVGRAQRALEEAHLALGMRPLADHQRGEIHRVHVRRRVGADRIAHVAERAGRAHALEIGALDRLDAARAVNQIEESRKTLAEILAAAAGVTDARDAAQLVIERAGVQEFGRLPVYGWPWRRTILPQRGLRAALSQGPPASTRL